MARRLREVVLVLGIVIVGFGVVAVIGLASEQGPQTGAPQSGHAGASPAGSPSTTAVDPASGLPTIARSALPSEARTALDAIAAGGPFRHDQDGSTYQNRERLLPIRPAGTYREYTVETPGSPDRGARRIVAASTGELFWTPDHYVSFARILP